MPTLHITNGDSAGYKLRRIVSGAVTITADPLHEGPAPRVDGEAWYDVRARFLAGGHAAYEDVKDTLASWDRAIVDGYGAGDIVLWFEHDLFDQLQLIRTLDLLVRLKPDTTEKGEPGTTEKGGPGTTGEAANPTPVAPGFSRTVPRVSLICIDRFPGVDRFVGLGQLSDDQLATLIGTERPVTAGQYALASKAWEAFRSPDPTEVAQIAVSADASRPLPFLRDALLRFFAEFPSVTNGLSRSEELALRALGDGPLDGAALFAATQEQEPRPFMGDTIFYAVVRSLASAHVPLVTISGAPDEPDLRSHVMLLTDAGRDVLAGRRDHIALNGIDLWRGGVHLAAAASSPWRWDARGERLVS